MRPYWLNPKANELAVGCQLSFTPTGDATPEFDRTVTNPLDYLGDNGWELVGSTVFSSAIRTGKDIGWQTSLSEPPWIDYILNCYCCESMGLWRWPAGTTNR